MAITCEAQKTIKAIWFSKAKSLHKHSRLDYHQWIKWCPPHQAHLRENGRSFTFLPLGRTPSNTFHFFFLLEAPLSHAQLPQHPSWPRSTLLSCAFWIHKCGIQYIFSRLESGTHAFDQFASSQQAWDFALDCDRDFDLQSSVSHWAAVESELARNK